MNAAFMSFQRHERGIHALSVSGGHVSPVTTACLNHKNIRPKTRVPDDRLPAVI